jgi:hypothetical protein
MLAVAAALLLMVMEVQVLAVQVVVVWQDLAQLHSQLLELLILAAVEAAVVELIH